MTPMCKLLSVMFLKIDDTALSLTLSFNFFKETCRNSFNPNVWKSPNKLRVGLELFKLFPRLSLQTGLNLKALKVFGNSGNLKCHFVHNPFSLGSKKAKSG